MIYRKSFSASPDKQQSRQADDWRPQPAYYKYKSFRQQTPFATSPVSPDEREQRETVGSGNSTAQPNQRYLLSALFT